DPKVAGAEERKRLAGDVLVDEPCQQRARARAGEGEDAVPGSDVLEPNVHVVLVELSSQPGVIVLLRCRSRHDIEPLGPDARHRQVALDAATRPACLTQRDPADLRRSLVREHSIEERLGSRPGDGELGEARLVEDADAGADGAALLPDGIEPVATAERVLVASRVAVAREPERALPAEAAAEDGAAGQQALVDRVGLQRPTCRQLLLRIVDRVLPLVDLACPRDEVWPRGGVAAEATDVELPHVVARLAVDDPFRGIAARAAGEDDPEDAEAGEDMEV